VKENRVVRVNAVENVSEDDWLRKKVIGTTT